MIRGLARPLGWSARDLELAAVVARYHRGTLPRLRGKAMQLLELPDRRVATELAAVLRLANALDVPKERSEETPRLEVEVRDNFVLLRASRYSAMERSAEDVAAARHLLEVVLRRPVLVRGMRPPASTRRPRKPV